MAYRRRRTHRIASRPGSRWWRRCPSRRSTVERSRWRGSAGREVVLFAIRGGGHSIPGGIELGSPWLSAPLVGSTNQDVNGADEVWAFVSRHPR